MRSNQEQFVHYTSVRLRLLAALQISSNSNFSHGTLSGDFNPSLSLFQHLYEPSGLTLFNLSTGRWHTLSSSALCMDDGHE
jgi:hypothetical protein